MKRYRLMTSVLMGAVTIAGCAKAPRVDATNDATLARSFVEVGRSLPEAEREKFTLAAYKLALGDDFKGYPKVERSKIQSKAQFFKALHGMTGREVISKGK
jgi:hypothetical protein